MCLLTRPFTAPGSEHDDEPSPVEGIVARSRSLDPVWQRVRGEAEAIVRTEPAIASFVYATILNHDRLEDAIVHRIAAAPRHQAWSAPR